MLRFAPSPTGEMHIDTLRVAIVNYIVAKQRQEPFLVRIDDGDKAHIIEGKDTEIMEVLEKFAIMHDQVYHQSEHLHIHQTLAIRLLEEKKAYICTCFSSKEKNDNSNLYPLTACSGTCQKYSHKQQSLKESGEPFVIRLKKPQHNITFTDLIKGTFATSPEEIGEIIILDMNGMPTPDFATACDDMLNSISLVIRKETHLFSTPKQIHIKRILGYHDPVEYAHLPTLLTPDGKSTSKEDKRTILITLLKEGFIPDAIVNYLLLISNTKAPTEIFTLPEAIAWFDLATVPKSPTKLDMDKLRFINREHLKRLDDKRLSALFGFADADIGKLAKLYLEEASTVSELEEKIKAIFSPKPFEGEYAPDMCAIQKVLIDAPMFDTFDDLKAYVQQETELEEVSLYKPLRLLLTGSQQGPELSDIYPYIRCYLLEVIS